MQVTHVGLVEVLADAFQYRGAHSSGGAECGMFEPMHRIIDPGGIQQHSGPVELAAEVSSLRRALVPLVRQDVASRSASAVDFNILPQLFQQLASQLSQGFVVSVTGTLLTSTTINADRRSAIVLAGQQANEGRPARVYRFVRPEDPLK